MIFTSHVLDMYFQSLIWNNLQKVRIVWRKKMGFVRTKLWMRRCLSSGIAIINIFQKHALRFYEVFPIFDNFEYSRAIVN